MSNPPRTDWTFNPLVDAFFRRFKEGDTVSFHPNHRRPEVTLATDIIEGRCCAECGVYFTQPHGYPVLCAHDWGSQARKDVTRKRVAGTTVEINKHGYQKAFYREL